MHRMIDSAARMLGRRPSARPTAVPRRRATFQPLRDETLRAVRWAPLG